MHAIVKKRKIHISTDLPSKKSSKMICNPY